MMMTPSVEAALHSRIGSIPGCRMATTGWSPRANGRPGDLMLDVIGWSPSLHSFRMAWTLEASAKADAPTLIGLMKEMLDLQETRARAGIQIGTALPYAMHTGSLMAHEHLHADASQLALLMRNRADGVRSPMEIILQALLIPLKKLHQGMADGKARRVGDKKAFMSDLSEKPLIGATCPVASMKVGEDRCTLRGPLLTIPRAIPETAAVQAVGRRLEELMESDPLLAKRTISHVTVRDDETVVLLEPRTMKLGDVINLDYKNARKVTRTCAERDPE